MTVPPPTEDELAPVPVEASFEESFWRDYAIDVAGYRESWVDDLLTDGSVAALVRELGSDLDE